jgi:hypothetical protein
MCSSSCGGRYRNFLASRPQNSPPNATGSQFMITSSPVTSAFPCRWLVVV